MKTANDRLMKRRKMCYARLHTTEVRLRQEAESPHAIFHAHQDTEDLSNLLELDSFESILPHPKAMSILLLRSEPSVLQS